MPLYVKLRSVFLHYQFPFTCVALLLNKLAFYFSLYTAYLGICGLLFFSMIFTWTSISKIPVHVTVEIQG